MLQQNLETFRFYAVWWWP